jgi:hypothetical protein
MSRLYCWLVIIGQPVGNQVGHPANPSKPLPNHTGSMVISNWHYWGILIVTLQSGALWRQEGSEVGGED